MGRIFKLVGIVVVAIVVLFVAALVAVGMLFDPNDYKDDITAAVTRATGRQLTLDGNLELAVFPSVRIAVGAATLANASGFGGEPMAKIKSAELKVALLPLLSKRIQIGEARLEGLELNLARDARGRNNWQDLGGAQSAGAAPASAAGGGSANLDLGIGAIEVDDARVTWSDAATGSRWELTNFGMTAEGFGPGAKFPLEMRFGLSGKDVSVTVDANTQATLSLADNQYRLDDLEVHIDGRGAAWPGGSGSADVGFDSLIAKLNDETLELDGLNLSFLGITTTGSLSGQKLMSNLSLTGAVDIHEFDPRDVLEVFGVKVETADGAVLKRASAKASLVYNSSQIALRDMQLALDDSKLTGRVALAGKALSYDLAVDDIDVDRYLPPSSDTPADEGSLDEVDLPLAVLRTLNAKGDLKLKKAKFSGLTLTDTTFSLAAADGRIQLKPAASLYGGHLGGDIVLQVQQDAARMTVNQQLDKVNLAPLGHDLIASDAFSGTGDVRLNVTATGSNLGEMRRKLDGDVSLSVVDGALEGIDFWYELRRARATIDKTPVPARPAGTPRTPFTSVSASGMVKDAVLTNRDLNANLGFMNIDGTGTVNLLTDAIRFDLTAKLTDGEQLQSDPAMAKMAGGSVPLKVTGTLEEPSVLPDFGGLVKAKAQEAVNQRVDEKKQEVQDKLKDKLKGLLNR